MDLSTNLELKSWTVSTIFVNLSVLKGTFHHQKLSISPGSSSMKLKGRVRQDTIAVKQSFEVENNGQARDLDNKNGSALQKYIRIDLTTWLK